MKDTRSEEKRKHIDGQYLLLPVKLFMSFVQGAIKGHLQPHVYIFIHQSEHLLAGFFYFSVAKDSSANCFHIAYSLTETLHGT